MRRKNASTVKNNDSIEMTSLRRKIAKLLAYEPGISQAECARRVGCDQSSISRLLKNETFAAEVARLKSDPKVTLTADRVLEQMPPGELAKLRRTILSEPAEVTGRDTPIEISALEEMIDNTEAVDALRTLYDATWLLIGRLGEKLKIPGITRGIIVDPLKLLRWEVNAKREDIQITRAIAKHLPKSKERDEGDWEASAEAQELQEQDKELDVWDERLAEEEEDAQ